MASSATVELSRWQFAMVRGEGLLPAWGPFAAVRVADGLRGEGVGIRTGAEVERLTRDGSTGVVTPYLADGSTVESEEFLVATGRSPRTAGLGLETVGLAPGGRLLVDDSCRVTEVAAGWLYAAGDINQRSPLTHMGKYQARACAAAIAARAAGRHANPTPGPPGRPPPTTTPYRRWSSPGRRPPPSA
ncbi:MULTISPECIES: FAD-dependent oxidoreductase [unclassified Kitasatospora]|uniref:FAD-dependent oxidoreductase n=1 Tax=unclassified Kitasatospora TaxID=2633591 RepID=UPI003815368C